MTAKRAPILSAWTLLVAATAASGQYPVGVYGQAPSGTDLLQGYSVWDSRFGFGTRYGYAERYGYGTRYGYGNRYGNEDPYVSRYGAGTRYGYGDRFGYIPFDYDQRTSSTMAPTAPVETPTADRSYEQHYPAWQPRHRPGPIVRPRAASTQTSAPAER